MFDMTRLDVYAAVDKTCANQARGGLIGYKPMTVTCESHHAVWWEGGGGGC